MVQLSPAYVAALAAQFGSLSAFLGGFAATFLATLLAFGRGSRALTVAMVLAAVSAVAFIVSVVASSMLVALLHPDAPRALGAGSADWPRALMTLTFGLGIFALLLSVAASGWLHSRRMGWATSTIAGIGIALTLTLTVQIG